MSTARDPQPAAPRPSSGPGRALVAVYGVFALAASRRYAETYVLTAPQGLLIRTADLALDALDENDITATESAQRPVLVDATALYVLNVLNADARSACLSAYSTLQVTRPTLDDLKATRDHLAVRGTMSVGYDVAAERLVAMEIAPEIAAAHATTARRLLELATTSATVVAAAKPTRAAQARDIHAGTFLGLLETCKADGQALWSDDPALRAIARAEGIPTFGTYALLGHLRATGTLTATDYATAVLDLTQASAIDLPIDLEGLRAVARRQEWQPGAAAFALARPAAWQMAGASCQQLLGEAFRHQASNPVALAGWMGAASEGICMALPDPRDVVAPLAALLALGIVSLAVRPAGVRALVDATRTVSGRHGVDDPWPAAVRTVRDALLRQHPEPEVRLILTTLAVDLEPGDRAAMFEALLEVSRPSGTPSAGLSPGGPSSAAVVGIDPALGRRAP